ncbi:hypothetical protein PAECIP112173_02924 [Paenibacillus sp. JJ-100]|uniref:hypothetical protein n=1 Tax=Paenibacillus sp. JJ-100 TaxID=2974896 RepID=UPI0022FF7352|nr:hypothetical protein [Paenibacillus sp. JJ-100]CAI6080550.1 hypothetical protein PAECIP112173_02924 [Paenibacillus sp. JJ-100]
MKMILKNVTLLSLIITLVLSFNGVSSASSESIIEKGEIAENTMSIPGYMVSKENIQRVIGSEEYLNYIAEEKLVHRTKLLIDNLTLDGDAVHINGLVRYNGGVIPLQLDGKLYSSREQSDGIESYVGDLKENNDSFKVLHFKIKTNDKADTSLISTDLRNTANIKLYLQDKKGDMFYFEEKLNHLNMDTSKITTDGSYVDSLLDGNWFEQILAPAESYKITNEEISPSSTHSYIKSCSTVYYSKVPFGLDVAEFYFCPKVEGDIVDVGSSASANWTSRLTVAEHVRVNGTTTTGIEQRYKIGGVTSGGTQTLGTIAAGQNTKITSRLIGGVYKKSSSEVKVNWPVIVGYFTKSVPYYAAGKSAYDVLTSISYNTTTTNVSNNTYENVIGNASGYSYKIDKSGYLYDASHYLDLGLFVSTWRSQETKNESTTAYINWKFDVSFLGSKVETLDWKIPVNYKVNVN